MVKKHAPAFDAITTISFYPSEHIVLSSELNLTALFAAFNVSKEYIELRMYGTSGIEVTGWPYDDVKIGKVVFYNSSIKFYVHKKQLSDLKCSFCLAGLYSNTFFTTFASIQFFRENKYTAQPVCPYIFANAQLNELLIYRQTGGNGDGDIRNVWEFEPYEDEANETTINSNIEKLSVGGSDYTVNTSLVHPLVFEMLTELGIWGSPASVQLDLFKHFAHLSLVSFKLNNMDDFFHQIGIDWTLSMLANTFVVFAVYEPDNSTEYYTYPDTDFCLFAHWPHHNGIIPVLDSDLAECTSTIRWLLTRYFLPNDISKVFNLSDDAQYIYSVCENSTLWTKRLSDDPGYFETKIATECGKTALTSTITPVGSSSSTERSRTNTSSTDREKCAARHSRAVVLKSKISNSVYVSLICICFFRYYLLRVFSFQLFFKSEFL
jgi:hypothetical protein